MYIPNFTRIRSALEARETHEKFRIYNVTVTVYSTRVSVEFGSGSKR